MGESKDRINWGSGWIYCFMDGEDAVFLDRRDRVIERFETMEEALLFANANIHLIDTERVKQ